MYLYSDHVDDCPNHQDDHFEENIVFLPVPENHSNHRAYLPDHPDNSPYHTKDNLDHPKD